MKRDETYYQAMLARDHRFDGKFFVGVKTTGIYCRPICPAKPKRQNVEFFHSYLEAERAGYRPCLRCRPESAPHSAAWIGKSATVQRAIKVLHAKDTIDWNENQFAAQFGVSARHLRRLFIDEIGKTPKQLCFENRLGLARKLIAETTLPISNAAFAAGFGSIRQFNQSFKQRFKKSPSEIRRTPLGKAQGLVVSLSYRPPFDFEGLLQVYRSHQVGSLEWFEDEKMHRVIAFNKTVGQIHIQNDPENSRLLLEIDFADTSVIHAIIAKVRTLFDLDSDPLVIANSVEADAKLKALLKKYPGIRLHSGWSAFETAISTILGQLVSVDRGKALVASLIEMLGADSGVVINGKPVKLFPTPEKIADADLSDLKTTKIRKQTLKAFSKAVAEGSISLQPTQDVDIFVEKLLSIKGIGQWTADYMALKVLRHTDAFPATDLILARAMALHSKEVIAKTSPWRGYVAALLWREYAGTLSKSKRRKT